MRRAAVIDLGSNSIKATVFDLSDRSEVARHAEQVRIFTSGPPDDRPPQALIQEASEAVRRLVEFSRAHEAEKTVIVGTSAVRESSWASSLAARIKELTGLKLAVLSGESEARIMARGVRNDRNYSGYPDLVAFDLGGGSLEFAQMKGARMVRALSLKLGSVRLTQGFLGDGEGRLSDLDIASISSHVSSVMDKHLHPRMADTHLVVGAGGAFNAIAMHLEAAGEPIQGGRIPVLRIRELQQRLCGMGLDARRAVPGIPADRADIMPAALVTISTLASLCGAEAFHLTHHGVRHGMLDVLLSPEGALL